MENCHCGCDSQDHAPCPYVVNIPESARQNRNFRTAVWTGMNLQMTLMSIPPCGEIGAEMHADTDQLLRVEQGIALVKYGNTRGCMSVQKRIGAGDAVFVPAGTWHNVMNAGRVALKVSSIYAPPHHPWGTCQTEKLQESALHTPYEP